MTSPKNPALVRELQREMLADLLDDAARLLRWGPDADAQALAEQLAKLEGPHRAAWLKMAPLMCGRPVRAVARRTMARLCR